MKQRALHGRKWRIQRKRHVAIISLPVLKLADTLRKYFAVFNKQIHFLPKADLFLLLSSALLRTTTNILQSAVHDRHPSRVR